MMYMERWKVILVSFVCVFAILYALPNALSKTSVTWMQEHLPAFLPQQTVNLGLDLRGGSHLLLEVDSGVVIEERMQSLMDQVRTDLRAAKVGYKGLAVVKSAVRFQLTDESQVDKARDVIREMDNTLIFSSVGADVSFEMSEDAIKEKKKSAIEQSIEIVRRRIDETGTREPWIQRQGDSRILVQLPGVENPERIKNLLGQTAKLSFRLVDEMATSSSGILPPGTERLPSAETEGASFVVQKRIMVSGDTLVDSQPSFQDGQAVVSFRFDSIGGKKFGEATRVNVNRLFAIILDNKVISAPVIREPILGGSGVISGHFTTQSAQDLALLLRAGALPAPIKVIEERTVGPGLGEDSINAGMIASFMGLGLVIVFFLVAYGLFGVFANLALLINMALVLAILSILQATLTLPGIAGIILTMGTALDGSVLIFERIREELRLGRSPLSAIDAGYKHALSAIIDANTTTLIAAFLMFMFGSGPVKGFAVTLSIGILTAMFCAIMVTRFFVVLWIGNRKLKELPL